jgi:sporulation protein YlmC with PRC-barrel domain
MDHDRYAEAQERERSGRSRQSSIFGRQEDRWDGRYDRSWRDDERQQDWSRSSRPRREEVRSSRSGFDRSGRASEFRARRNQDYRFGPDDDREGLPRDETGYLIASNKVEGTAVYGRDGNRLGTIYNFMVDKRSGRVEYAVMSYGGLLGMGTRYYPIPWQMLRYQTDVGGYEAGLSERDLEEAPSFDERNEPSFDRAYGRDVFAYYGLFY